MAILQILELTETSVKINTTGFHSILEKAADLPIVLISMNGSSREGKSFALNYFIRYFKSGGSKNWFDNELQPEETFSYKSGRERETVGINLYSEPFVVTKGSGEKLAVLLLDCQGLFDDKTTFKQNAVIFALSNLFSSVLIYNVKAKIEENLLQNIQFFSSYAQAITNQQDCEILLPSLTFLVRDFAFDYEYPLGYHTPKKCPQEGTDNAQNYFQASLSISEDMPLENKIVRKEILNKFEPVSLFLLPFPGKSFLMNSSKNKPDEDFQNYLRQFVQMMTSENCLTPKIINGKEVTGRELQQRIIEWAILCEESASKFPEAQTLAESQRIMRNEMALSNAASIFTESNEGIQAYQNSRRNEKPDVLQGNLEKLQESFKETFESYYWSRNQNILAKLEAQNQGALRNQEVVQSLTQELTLLNNASAQECQSGAGTQGTLTPTDRTIPPKKPIRKSPPKPPTVPQVSNAGLMDHRIEDTQWTQPRIDNSVSLTPGNNLPPQQQSYQTSGVDSDKHNKAVEDARLLKKWTPFSTLLNFFSKYFVKAPSKFNRNVQSLIRKKK
ncbi:unnamed protein product [Allacma fusca]|uniref:GB1/RHD3-type G domain-containing protein n=1 Tax=Allacma fusca TaxID=39272 RepID=A0A8J2LR27_9HEXA|nr:unnamed protein product [Allacma fusca]